MPKKENAALVAQNDALKDCGKDSTPDTSLASVYSVFGKSFLSAAAAGFKPSPYCPEKEMPIEAEAYAMRAVCDAIRARKNPHAVPLDTAALAVRVIMQFIAHRLGEKDADGNVKKAAFAIPPRRSEATCARLILAREHIVMVFPDDGTGRPLDTQGRGVLVRYIYDGVNAGVHVPVASGWLHDLVDKLCGGQSAQRFANNVAQTVEDFVVADESAHVIEDTDARLVAFVNGLLDVETGELLPFSPDVVRLNKSPVVWRDAPADCPFTRSDGVTYATPKDLLRSWVASDELLNLLLQVARHTLMGTGTKIGKMVTLYNETGANGKSTFIGILRRLVGDGAVISPTIEDLANGRFALAGLVGARLIAMDDTDGGDYVKRAARTKSIITGGRITIEQKGKDPFYYSPRALLIGAMNNFALARDKSGGWLRRQLLIPFGSQFLGVADSRIDDWSTSPEFLTWLAHYVLTEVDDFDANNIPVECQELLREYQRNNDNVLAFFEEVIDAIPSPDNPDENGRFCNFVSVTAAFKAYRFWLRTSRPGATSVPDFEFKKSFRAAAASSPNWLAEIDSANKLKQYRIDAYTNAGSYPPEDNGARLFPVDSSYNKALGRNATYYAHARTQCGKKGGRGRGIIRVSPTSATPADDDDSTPER